MGGNDIVKLNVELEILIKENATRRTKVMIYQLSYPILHSNAIPYCGVCDISIVQQRLTLITNKIGIAGPILGDGAKLKLSRQRSALTLKVQNDVIHICPSVFYMLFVLPTYLLQLTRMIKSLTEGNTKSAI